MVFWVNLQNNSDRNNVKITKEDKVKVNFLTLG